LLALMLAITALAARGLGFSREDQIAIVFCGSKKSLVTGIPDGEFAVCRPFVGPHRPAVDGVLLDPAHGLRRARPALRQGCEIARNSHPLR
jgi:SBF-like CPA transporter family (DUF4137)